MISVRQVFTATFFACAGMVAGPTFADTVADFIFDETILADLKSGSTLVYTHDLFAPDQAPHPPFEDGAINVLYEQSATGSGEVVISFDRGRAMRSTSPMPTVGGNPLVMVFLESSTRAMAGIAGGSPFYIRNRIKNALMSGGTETTVEVEIGGEVYEVRQITLTPFANDQNQARMGSFSQLEMRFTYGDDVPGGIHELRTFVPMAKGEGPLYEERIVFSNVEEPK